MSDLDDDEFERLIQETKIGHTTSGTAAAGSANHASPVLSPEEQNLLDALIASPHQSPKLAEVNRSQPATKPSIASPLPSVNPVSDNQGSGRPSAERQASNPRTTPPANTAVPITPTLSHQDTSPNNDTSPVFDDDEDAERILQQLLSEATKTSEDVPSPSDVNAKDQGSTSRSLAEVPANSVAAAGLGKARHADTVAGLFSLQEEDDILQAILGAMQDQKSSVSSELGADTFEVEAVLEHAERVVTSSSSGDMHGSSVLYMHENHSLKEELKKSKSSAGWPTCIDTCLFFLETTRPAPSAPVMCIGTTLGLVILLSSKNKICGVCGSVKHGSLGAGEVKGSVTAVSFSRDGTRVAAGYEGGQVIIWATDSLKPVKTFDGDFSAPVVRILFLHPDPNKALAMDATGSIKCFLLSVVMMQTVGRSTSVYTGFECPCSDIATVCDANHRLLAGGAGSHVVGGADSEVGGDVHYLAAICSERLSVFSANFRISANINLAHSGANPKPSAFSNETVAWVASGSQRILCACWSVSLEIYHLLTDVSGHPTLQVTNRVDLSKPIHSLSALDGTCALLCDQDDRLLIVDTKAGVMVESVQLVKFDLVSYSSRQCGIKYQGQMSSSGGYVMLLGQTRVMFCTLLSWEARIDALISARKWDEAFALAKDFALEIAVAVVGFHADSRIRRREIQTRIEQLITSYISDAARTKPSHSEYASIVTKLIGFCSEIDAMDVFFSHVLPFLQGLQVKDVALSCLEGSLSKGVISSMPEIHIRSFVDLFHSPARLANLDLPHWKIKSGQSAATRLEQALMMLTDNLDTLKSIAETTGMHRLVASILSFRQHQHVEALQYLIRVGQLDIACDYIDRTFETHSLIEGKDIVPIYRKQAREALVAHLTTDPKSLSSLLKYDASLVLSIVGGIVIPQPNDYYSCWGGDKSTVTKYQLLAALQAQLIDKNNAPNKPWEAEQRKWPPYIAILQYFLLFVPLVAQGDIRFPSTETERDFYLRAIYHCGYSYDKANADRKEAIESVLDQMLVALKPSSSLLAELEGEVKGRRIGRVYADILAQRGDFATAIQVFLSKEHNAVNPRLQGEVFTFIRTNMEKARLHGENEVLAKQREAVKIYIERLVAVDAATLAQLVFEFLPNDHRDVLRALQGSSETFLTYLRGVISKGEWQVNEDKHLQNTYIRLLCVHEPQTVYQYLLKHDTEIQYDIGEALAACRSFNVTNASIYLLEKTMQIGEAMRLLMASITDVMMALREDVIQRPSHYAEKFLNLSELAGSMAFENASVLGAQLAMEDLSFARTVKLFSDTSARINNNAEDGCAENGYDVLSPADDALFQMVVLGNDLCGRYREKIGVDQLSILWFSLLDRFAKPKKILFDRQQMDRNLSKQSSSRGYVNGFEENEILFSTRDVSNLLGGGQGSAMVELNAPLPVLAKPLTKDGRDFIENMQSIYTRYMSLILNAMVKALPLSTVVGKIVADNQHEKFGPFKPIIVGILETLSFDLEVNRLCKLCADDDTMKVAESLRATMMSGISLQSEYCAICHDHLAAVVGELDSLRLFPCGHAFHEECCGTLAACYVCNPVDDDDELTETKRRSRSQANIGGRSGQDTADRAKQNVADTQQDINAIMRKLRFTKNKLDNHRTYLDALDTLMSAKQKDGGGSSHADKDVDRKSVLPASRGLLLAPAPSEPFSLMDIQIGALPSQITVTEEIADIDLINIFGEDAMAAIEEHYQEAIAAGYNGSDLPDLGGGDGGDDDLDEQERILFARTD